MAGENTMSTMSGNFKDIFHDKLEDLMPDYVLLQKGLVDWVPADKLNGQFYSVPTVVRSNQGVTYLGEAGGVSALNAVANGKMVEAQINGSEINVRGQMSFKTLSTASSQGPKAFKKASAWLIEDLANVAYTRLEIAALYGQTGLGIVESVVDATGGLATIVITEATFAPGIWTGAEGAALDSYTSTTLNSVTTLTLGSTAGSVNLATRTLYVTYTGSFDVAQNDVLTFKGSTVTGQSSWSEMVGLYKQLTATSGTLFNIDKALYNLNQGNVKSSVGILNKTKVLDAAMLCVEKGAMSDLTLLISTKGWAKLAAEDMALRAFDQSYSKSKSSSGSKELEIDYLGGTIKVVCHPMVKYGEAFLFNPDNLIWVGSSKPTFDVPSLSERFYRVVNDYNAVEFQCFADVAIYALKPAQCAVMTGITNS